MHPYEQSQQQQQQFYLHSFDSEPSASETYPSTTMAGYAYTTTAFNNTLPFAFCDPPTQQVDSMDSFKYDMIRSTSNNSMTHVSTEYPPALLASGSIGSTTSSTVGSPYSGPAHMVQMHGDYHVNPQTYLNGTTIVCEDAFTQDYASNHDMSFPDHDNKSSVSYTSVDPNLLHGSRSSLYTQPSYNNSSVYGHAGYSYSNSPAPSPAPSHHSYSAFSQPLMTDNYTLQREQSVVSHRSVTSPRTSVSGDEAPGEKDRCPYPDCGRVLKDLKAHILTHLSERPEKCPIPTCEYSTKGFSRKYDKNRHTLTHYKGTMVCGFCPGSGSSAEKSFNRADVFKRHLTQVHGVEQNPPNSRKRSPGSSNRQLSSYCQDATGKCSTCFLTFNNAQEFYEHLDDCVLSVVKQQEPSELINAMHLATVASDPALQETFERNMIKLEDVPQILDFEDEEDDDIEDDEAETDTVNDRFGKVSKTSKRVTIGGGISKNKASKKGASMTWSKIGVSLVAKGRKRRRNYPPSWGMSADKMKMKKRVLCVYDGNHRLLKDDMMLNNEFEVRMRLKDGINYVTDLDTETLKRANAFHNATEEEKGPAWIEEQDLFDLMS